MTKTHHDKTTAELVGEKKDSVKDEAATELAKEAVIQEARLDTGTKAEDDGKRQWHGWDEIQLYAHLLDGGIAALTAAIEPKSAHPVPEEKIYGLLALERNGQNRTDFVKLMMHRLGLKSDELPGGGPDYTNDVTNITSL